jgi:hypothetical protein
VPRHLHREGVEIHLGYSPIHGHTILADNRAEVTEGYAMPIPPLTAHGYLNASEQPHHVPFIFGSLKAGGWGVFLDVEPQPFQLEELKAVELSSAAMNHSVYLEREIDLAQSGTANRRIIIPASATDRDGTGGLELAVTRVPPEGTELPRGSYRIVSVVRGAGRVRLAGAEQTLTAHDHFGIPAGMTATLWPDGPAPLIILDAVLESHASRR